VQSIYRIGGVFVLLSEDESNYLPITLERPHWFIIVQISTYEDIFPEMFELKLDPRIERFGFVVDSLGSHSSRTIMLNELQLVLSSCARGTNVEDYKVAILENNVLHKNTDATRKESFRRLRELYGLDEKLLNFRALRDLWSQNVDAQPLIAVLCACTRDPILRATTDVIFTAQVGDAVDAHMISKFIAEQVHGQLNEMTLGNFGRHIASSWTQSGHLSGRANKVRAKVKIHPTSVAYALFLGLLMGERGSGLFNTNWTKLLDAPDHELREQAMRASQQGWIEYRHSGNVTDVGFRYLTREEKHE
jgi:hypothetical protein